ncbi:MAG: RNA-binding S4 domain-containing protein [Rudaea sp.]|nr:RNA-binding S4 domain-containing protein [Rudaea sp.]
MTAADSVRLDIWLWSARFFKTRALAQQAIEAGRVGISALPCKPAKLLRVGDRLQIAVGEQRFEIDVLALSERRGPASVAHLLYTETPASRLAREAQREQRRLLGSDLSKPPSRPDKRARRLIRRFQAKD